MHEPPLIDIQQKPGLLLGTSVSRNLDVNVAGHGGLGYTTDHDVSEGEDLVESGDLSIDGGMVLG